MFVFIALLVKKYLSKLNYDATSGGLWLKQELRPKIAMKKQKDFSQGDFDKLLNLLNPIRQEAERKYESIYQRLIAFFEYNKCLMPEEQANETIDRGIEKIKKGTEITSLEAFLAGIARFVLKESRKVECPIPLPPENTLPNELHIHSPDKLLEKEAERQALDKRLECLELCMKKLGLDKSSLILEYYPDETVGRKEKREMLAKKLGIPNGTLRTRALRIREELQKCIEGCVK